MQAPSVARGVGAKVSASGKTRAVEQMRSWGGEKGSQ